MEWLNAHIAYWHWLVFGMVLALCEIFIASFFILWLGVSAVIVGGIFFLVDISFTQQLLIWIILSVATTLLWFKYVSPRMKDKSYAGMAKEAVVGQVGGVTSFNPETSQGEIRFHVPIMGSCEWPFISDDELRAGDRGRIIDFSGNRLIIKKQ